MEAIRIAFDSMYMDIAKVIMLRSVAQRRKVGALLVINNNIIAYGYNGTPAGFDNECEKVLVAGIGTKEAVLVTKPEVLHAESNAIAKCCVNGISSVGATLYTTACPCIECAKLIIQCKIKRVVYVEPYRNDLGLELLKRANIELCQLST